MEYEEHNIENVDPLLMLKTKSTPGDDVEISKELQEVVDHKSSSSSCSMMFMLIQTESTESQDQTETRTRNIKSVMTSSSSSSSSSECSEIEDNIVTLNSSMNDCVTDAVLDQVRFRMIKANDCKSIIIDGSDDHIIKQCEFIASNVLHPCEANCNLKNDDLQTDSGMKRMRRPQKPSKCDNEEDKIGIPLLASNMKAGERLKLYKKGKVFQKNGQDDLALKCYIGCLMGVVDKNDFKSLSKCLFNTAEIYMKKGEPENAEKFLLLEKTYNKSKSTEHKTSKGFFDTVCSHAVMEDVDAGDTNNMIFKADDLDIDGDNVLNQNYSVEYDDFGSFKNLSRRTKKEVTFGGTKYFEVSDSYSDNDWLSLLFLKILLVIICVVFSVYGSYLYCQNDDGITCSVLALHSNDIIEKVKSVFV